MKKKLTILGCVVLALAILAGGAYGFLALAKPFHRGDLSGYAEEFPYADREILPLYVDAQGDFTILQFTDTHLVNGRGEDARTYAGIETQTARVNPDLVVVTGDVVEGGGSRNRISVDRHAALDGLAGIFERREQPWAYVPGNNDNDDYMGTAADVAAYLAANYEYVIVASAPGIAGVTNYSIPLLYEDGGDAHELVFMDSRSRYHVGMEQDQAGWLEQRLLSLKERAPLARASVFFHHSTPAFLEAEKKGEYYPGYAANDLELWPLEGNYNIDDAMRAAGNVGLVSIGHIHPNPSWCYFYGSTYYNIVRASGYQRGDSNPGCVKITIHNDDGNPRRQYEFEDIVY